MRGISREPLQSLIKTLILRRYGVPVLVRQFALTCFRILDSSFRGPGTGLHIASLLQAEHEASIADHHLPRVKTLQDSL